MPESSFVHPIFGPIRFRTKSNQWVRGDGIEFLSGFDASEVRAVSIPQLRHIPGSHQGVLRFHSRGHSQLLNVFAEIENQGLLRHIKTCAGSFNQRLRKPTHGGISKLPSDHAFGIAIDLNSDDGSLGSSVAPVAPVFKKHGFRWGIDFNDPMHFEIASFADQAQAHEDPPEQSLPFVACLQKVSNRGKPPVQFLKALIEWARLADEEIFARNDKFDIYSAIVQQLGPWRGAKHRRAAMLEALRVLGGFESSWDWSAGRDPNNPNNSLCAEEAGVFQCSGDSLGFDQSLKRLLIGMGGEDTCASFILTTKTNHRFAIEYCARLLRFTTKHHGPVRFGHINQWLRRDAVDEFERFIG